MVPDRFRVGVSADFTTRATGLLEPILREIFDPVPWLEWEYFAQETYVVAPEKIAGYDAVVSLGVRYPAETLARAERLAVIARWGVGYDTIDIPAATEHGVLVCITPPAVRRPVAEGIMALLLAITKRIPAKDRIVRTGRWEQIPQTMGVALAGRTLGSVGIGNIGADFFRLVKPFDLGRMLAVDPYVSPAQAAALGVELVDLDTLLAESDFVCINCPLTKATFHMIGEAQVQRMKPTAFLINTARGPIIDQAAIIRALTEGWIAGAALDVFEEEPLPLPNPLAEMDNVILTPHAIAWTDQMARDTSTVACNSILTVLKGDIPEYTVNRAAAERPVMQAKLAALRQQWEVRG
ncbi:MAG: hydroxyacid dehydrogenase [Chloroflexota bacterium]|nr:hydroxyacid dehydrogenase [Chloroflexota bacterium]